jgi:PKD repeat protein
MFRRCSQAITAVALLALALVVPDSLLTSTAHAAQPSTIGPTDALPSSVPSANTPNVNNGRVFGIAQVGNTMVIGGTFTQVASQARSYVAAFDKTTGALTSFAPTLDKYVNQVIPGPNDHTVYVAGAFTTVNGAATTMVTELDLNTGQKVTAFTTPKIQYNEVKDIVLRGTKLYLAGSFTKVAGVARGGLAALNATTGALDSSVNIAFTGHHNDSGSGAQGAVGPSDLDVTPDGNTMVVVGNFKYAAGLLRNQIALVDLSGATAQVKTNWATSRFAPYCYNWAFDQYIRGVAMSPDGSYFVVTATGGGNPGTLCDSVTRWETSATGSDVQPTWIDQTGGDTVWGVTITGSVIYAGGHNRWMNDPHGVDSPQSGAVPRPGLEALDPLTGRPFKWNPGRVPLGVSVFAMLATDDGVWLGSDTDYIGNHKYKRQKLAFFPYAGGYQIASTKTANLPGTVFLAGSKAVGTTNVLFRVDAGGPAIQPLDNGPEWAADNSDPSDYRNNGSNSAGWQSGGATSSGTVPSTTPNAIFDSERWSPSDNPPMQWAFPVAAGTPIEVRLYFANRYGGTSGVGQRVFNVALDGATVLNHYDIVADVGDQTGTMKAFDITSDGTVNIDFSHVTENPLINGIEIVRTDVTPTPGNPDTLSSVAFDGTNGTSSDLANQGIDFGNWRGAFMVGNTVFYGDSDGYLYSRSFDGTTFGSAVKIDPYHDAYWDNIQTGDGQTFTGASPSLYAQFPNVTGMAYSNGRLYYTLYGDAHLYSRWFLPDSGIVDETYAQSTSSVDFSSAITAGKLYYGSRSDKELRSIAFDSSTGAVSGSSTRVGDGLDWSNRAMFLAPAGNQPPTAAFTSTCTDLTCSFDGSSSSDSDGTVVSYAWDFGDGSTGTGVTPSHNYTSPGTYTAKLIVKDDQGATSAAVSHDVSVAAPASNVGFVAAANAGGGNVKTKSVTVPSGAHVGDTALLFLANSSSATWTGPTGITGWTSAGTYTSGTLATAVWSKTLVAGDLGQTATVTSATSSHASLQMAVYSGVDTSSPIATSAQSGDTTKTSHMTPTVTAGSGDWVVSFWAGRSTATRIWTIPSGVTTRDATTDTGTFTVQSVLADSGNALSAGSYGGYTATTDANTAAAAMWTVALNSAP